MDAEQQKELYESLTSLALEHTQAGLDEFTALLKKLMYNSQDQDMWDVVKRWTTKEVC